MHLAMFWWFKWFKQRSLFKYSQWLSCHHWISLLLYDSKHGCPSGLRLNKKHLCVIPSYYSVSSQQQGRVIVGKLIGFAGLSALLNSHCGSVRTVITHHAGLWCVSSSGGKPPACKYHTADVFVTLALRHHHNIYNLIYFLPSVCS